MTKILIIDDEEPIRELLGQILEKNGYACTLAANAAQARECLKKQDFELVVSDIRMPGESGLDLIRYVLAEHPDTAALMVSALDNSSTAETALEIGAYGYIIKPFDSRGVLISVSNALRRRQLEIDNRAYRENLEQMVQERTAALKKNKEELEHTLARLKEIQAQMIQSEKMASIGQLAAGVAHEINNPTGFIGSNLNTLLEYQRDIGKLIKQYRQLLTDLKDIVTREEGWAAISEQLEGIVALQAETDIDFILDDVPDLIGESQDGTERLKRIVADLKDFAHPGKDKLESADINRCLESTLNVVWNELKYKATVTKEYGDLPLVVECYPHQLNQVFMNLLVNAAQAIENKGEIKIVTQALDGQVEIRISDTGSGIPKENLSKIFDAFFTTKEVGKGTGLGLNVAYKIIQKHKGTIDVESEVGKGTTFTIRLQIEPDLVE